MKQLNIAWILLAFAALFSLSPPAEAQYTISRSSFTTGGVATNTGFQVRSSLGVPAPGIASSTTIVTRAGFWLRQWLPTLADPVLLALSGATQAGFTPTLDWNDVTGATTYTLEVANNAGFSESTVVAGLTSSQYTFSTRLADGVYHWRVKAVGPCVQSNFSSADTFVIIPAFGKWTVPLLALAMIGYMVWYNRRPRA